MVSYRISTLEITNSICRKVLEVYSSTASTATSDIKCCDSWRGLSHSLWFHRLSWTVAATVHMALTVLGVWVCFLGAPPFFSISPPTSPWLWVHLLPIEGTVTHCNVCHAQLFITNIPNTPLTQGTFIWQQKRQKWKFLHTFYIANRFKISRTEYPIS